MDIRWIEKNKRNTIPLKTGQVRITEHTITISKDLHEKQLNGAKKVLLGYSQDKKFFAIKPATSTDPNGFTLNPRNKLSKAVSVQVKQVNDRYNFKEIEGDYFPVWDWDLKALIISLKEKSK